MRTLAQALTFQRTLRDNGTLRMLRADHMPLMAAVLGAHLASPGARIPTDDLHELIDGDLEELREPFGLGEKNGKAYCDDWRMLGILIRRPTVDARGETYELSAAAFDGLRILDQLDDPRTTLTESRLLSLAGTLRALAIDTDPDSTRKLAALETQRARIDEQIEQLLRGVNQPLADRTAAERFLDVLLQAQALPADFARVRAEFEALSHELRTSVLNSDDTRNRIIDDVFRGVDLIGSSDAGRTFSAFAALLRNAEQSIAFEDDISQILDRDFAQNLPWESRTALRRLMRDLKDGSRSVNQSLTGFARGLRRYVQSQEFQRDRELRGLVQSALASALDASSVAKPYEETGLSLELSSLPIRSIGALSAHDPSDFDAGKNLDEEPLGVADIAMLALASLETEIDFVGLAANVNEMLSSHARVTVGEVLDHFPPMQGAASVVGLLSLATRYGSHDLTCEETLTWEGDDGLVRRATAPMYLFIERIDY